MRRSLHTATALALCMRTECRCGYSCKCVGHADCRFPAGLQGCCPRPCVHMCARAPRLGEPLTWPVGRVRCTHRQPLLQLVSGQVKRPRNGAIVLDIPLQPVAPQAAAQQCIASGSCAGSCTVPWCQCPAYVSCREHCQVCVQTGSHVALSPVQGARLVPTQVMRGPYMARGCTSGLTDCRAECKATNSRGKVQPCFFEGRACNWHAKSNAVAAAHTLPHASGCYAHCLRGRRRPAPYMVRRLPPTAARSHLDVPKGEE